MNVEKHAKLIMSVMRNKIPIGGQSWKTAIAGGLPKSHRASTGGAVRIIEDLGATVATPDEAREMLGLKAPGADTSSTS
jgi:hypothetical protein